MSDTGKALLILGIVLLVLGLGGGLGGTLLGMAHAFDTAAAEGASANPADLAGGIKAALLSTAVGLPVGLAGLVLLVVGFVVGLRNQPCKAERQEQASPRSPRARQGTE